MNEAQVGAASREWKVNAQSEYRFEVDSKHPIAIKVRYSYSQSSLLLTSPNTDQVTAGHAELFGSEMAPDRMYLFSYECKAAIFSWEGCTIQIFRPSAD
jgi:polyribonucleotide 5'-hydroxyl-kinase